MHMCSHRFKHGGRGWSNPFKNRSGERPARGNRGDLKTPEQVVVLVLVLCQQCRTHRHRCCIHSNRCASSGERLPSVPVVVVVHHHPSGFHHVARAVARAVARDLARAVARDLARAVARDEKGARFVVSQPACFSSLTIVDDQHDHTNDQSTSERLQPASITTPSNLIAHQTLTKTLSSLPSSQIPNKKTTHGTCAKSVANNCNILFYHNHLQIPQLSPIYASHQGYAVHEPVHHLISSVQTTPRKTQPSVNPANSTRKALCRCVPAHQRSITT